MLTLTDVSVTYGGSVHALHDVCVTVPAGGVTAVLGANGAGKTTLLRAVSGTLGIHRGRIDKGSIEFNGRSLPKSPDAIVRLGIVQVPEGRRIFGRLTVEENLRIGGFGARQSRVRRATAHERVLDLFPVLADRATQRGSVLSGGEQQMLAIGRALMAEPRVLLLDEPSLGLAPLMVRRIGEVIAEIAQQGTTILLIEQNASLALAVASHGVVLETGRVTAAGTAGQLARDEDLRARYLGGHGRAARPAGGTHAAGGQP